MQHLFLLSLRLCFLALFALAIGCTPAYEMQQTAYNPDQPRWGEPEPPADQLQQAYRAPAPSSNQAQSPMTDGIPQQGSPQTPSNYFALFPDTPASSFTASTGSPTATPPPTFASPSHPGLASSPTTTNVMVDRSVLLEMRNTIDALLEMQASTNGQSLANLNQPTARQPRQQPPANKPKPSPTYARQDPNQLMLEQLQQRIQQAPAQQAPAQQPAFLEEESFFEAPAPSPPTYMVPVYLANGQTVQLDEKMLREWEAAILASKRGEPSLVELPAWLMKGLEMLTHAPTEEPARSQTIMPLYRELESAGYLRNVNLNNMSSRQVVAVLRFLVDDVKRNQGRLNRQ